MTHPSKDDSELGWIRIAVELGPCKFLETGMSSSGAGDNINVTGINTPANKKLFGATLHQNTCGHGFIPKAQPPTHRPDFRAHEHDNVNSRSMLGASPFEIGDHPGIGKFYRRYGRE